MVALSPQWLSSTGSPSFHHGSQLIGSRDCKQEAAAGWPASPAVIYWLSSEAAVELYNARAGGALINHPLTPYFTGVGIYTERVSACIRSPSEAKVRTQVPVSQFTRRSSTPCYGQGEDDRLAYMDTKMER